MLLDRHIVPDLPEPVRLSDYACSCFPDVPSRKGIKKAIQRGQLHVNGAPETTGYWVQTGDQLELYEAEPRVAKVFELPLPVIYEDDDLAVVLKPAGYKVSGNQFQTIHNALPFNLKPPVAGANLATPLPVHRLDKPTSGLLLVAKSLKARIDLGEQLKQQSVKKRYQAVVIGQMPEAGFIDEPLEGKPARTRYHLLDTCPSLKNETLSWLDLWPETGRTHQLRKHLAGVGFPILGDAEYGREGMILKGKGLFLCAVALEFRHPSTGSVLQLEIEAPHKFYSLFERERRRWERYQ
ncbi:MAG: RluA family pseudouridine synthase [Phaeodactylibacter sp.]|nr:RluA family pseudouridine synthase [Phaeodactylibacter sp.]